MTQETETCTFCRESFYPGDSCRELERRDVCHWWMNMDDSAKRARVAYESFRNGFPAESWPMPEWDKAPFWVRDVVLVAYLQGTLDAPKRS